MASRLETHIVRELTIKKYPPATIAAFVQICDIFRSMPTAGLPPEEATPETLTSMLADLLTFQRLSPITNDPAEWVAVGSTTLGKALTLHQNIREPKILSADSGKTWFVMGQLKELAQPSTDVGATSTPSIDGVTVTTG